MVRALGEGYWGGQGIQRVPLCIRAQTTTSAMLRLAITFLVIALIAAALGFGGIAGTSAWIAKVLFVVFLILFAVSLLFGRRSVV